MTFHRNVGHFRLLFVIAVLIHNRITIIEATDTSQTSRNVEQDDHRAATEQETQDKDSNRVATPQPLSNENANCLVSELGMVRK